MIGMLRVELGVSLLFMAIYFTNKFNTMLVCLILLLCPLGYFAGHSDAGNVVLLHGVALFIWALIAIDLAASSFSVASTSS